MAVTTNPTEVEEVEALAAELEGKLTAKHIKAWKEAVACYVRTTIFPRKQFVKDEEICWGSGIQKVICVKTLGRVPSKWQDFWDEQGGMEVVRRTINRRRQSSADGQKKNFQSELEVVSSGKNDLCNLMVQLCCHVEWMESATRTRNAATRTRNGSEEREEQVMEPPKPADLVKEMRNDTEKDVQFVVRMLPPVYGKEIWNEMAVKTNLSEFVTASQEAFALLLYMNGFDKWSWMMSDTSSSDGGDAVPVFKYTSRSGVHVMARNSGWSIVGMKEFNRLHQVVKRD